MTTPIDLATILGLLALMGVAARSDTFHRLIPNRFALAALFLYPAHVLASPIAIDWPTSLVLALIALGGGFMLFTLGWFGGGDVKLGAVAVLWAGPSLLTPLIMVVALTGGLLSIAAFAQSYRERRVMSVGGIAAARLVLRNASVPYGVAIAAGAAVVAVGLATPLI